MACLVAKIGNTSSVAALYERGRVFRCERLLREQQSAAAVSECIRSVVGRRTVERSAVCSVVPPLTRRWLAAARKASGGSVLEVSAQLELGISLDRYPRAKTLGADRLANLAAVAARGAFPAIVIDFGTATVFDVVDGSRSFLGGVIAPGLPLMTEYLARRTAQLPQIRAAAKAGGIGRSTRGAMQVGAAVGYRGLVKEILAHLEICMGSSGTHVCVTGGYAGQVLRSMHMQCDLDPHLTLRGIGRILELNPSADGKASR